MPEINPNYMGGNMRLGGKTTYIENMDSVAYKIYQSNEVRERHRHRYEVNPAKIDELEKAGLHFSGKDIHKIRMEVFISLIFLFFSLSDSRIAIIIASILRGRAISSRVYLQEFQAKSTLR